MFYKVIIYALREVTLLPFAVSWLLVIPRYLILYLSHIDVL